MMATDNPRDPQRSESARPVMGDHPELEDEPAPQIEPTPRRRDPLSPLVLGGVAALVLLLVLIVLLWVA